MGNPTTFTQEVADAIAYRVSKGEPLAQILRDEGMPPRKTVYNWLQERSEFATEMDIARDLGADCIAEEILEIADDGRNDWMEKFGRDGESLGYQVNGEHVQRSKLRVETRLKLLAKWHPKKYGDRLMNEHSGPGGGPVQFEKIERTLVRPK